MPIYKSPSTIIRPVDVVSTPLGDPVGTPAIIVGTSRRGEPFVPITISDFEDFVTLFGDIDSERFGPIAMQRWLSSRTAGTYVKLLGIGDGKRRISTGDAAGTVNKAGFVAGSQLVQSSSGVQTHNENAYLGGALGRTYFLGCFMSESAGSTIFSDADIQISGENNAKPILRGILIAASGVSLALNSEVAGNNTPSGVSTGEFSLTGDAGLSFGDIMMGSGDKQNFAVILNGFKPNAEFGNVITASFDPNAPVNTETDGKPLRLAFNTDPTKLEKAGHYLHLFYDVDPKFAVPTASNVTSHVDTNTPGATFTDGINAKLYQTAFLLTASLSRNSGSQTTTDYVGVPNFENFENRYQSAFSPTVFSQKIEGQNYDLFKIYAKDAGTAGSTNYKITIDEFDTGNDTSLTPYPKFNLHVRPLNQPDKDFAEVGGSLETFEGITLDPADNKFISKVIGDRHVYYDFDKDDAESQKIVDKGDYLGTSALIRVEPTDAVREGRIPPKALPIGFRGIYHLVTSGSTQGSSILTGTAEPEAGSEGSLGTSPGITTEIMKSVVQPPLSFRRGLFSLGAGGQKVVDNDFTWGMQVETKNDLSDLNGVNTFDQSLQSHLLYMPDFHRSYQNVWVGDNHGVSDVGGCVFDADRFNNNVFTLERVEVLTSSTDTPDPDQWAHALYSRSGRPAKTLQNSDGVAKESRFLRAEDFEHKESQKYYRFTFPLMGGFDGVNIFDYEKSNFTNTAIVREMEDAAQGKRKGPTVTAYLKAFEILEDKIAYPGSVLSTPGIRHEAVVDEGVELANRRADIFYIFDLQEKDDSNVNLTGSFVTTAESLTNTRNHFLNNPRETTYAAAYFPDIRIDIDLPEDDSGLTGHRVPPTVGVLGAMSREVDHAKLMGVTRGDVGALSAVVNFNDSDLDEFFQAGINVISGPTLQEGAVSTAGSGPFLRSQNTLVRSLSPMSRVAIRRMLLHVRRAVRETMESFIFEKLTPGLYVKVRNSLNDVLIEMQSQGMFKFYQLDVPETLQENREDVNKNALRARILIRPNDASESLIIDSSEGL